MKCYRVTMDEGLIPYTEKDIETTMVGIREVIEQSDKGARITIDILEMTEEEYAALPEWMGP